MPAGARLDPALLAKFFAPRSVAVVGASSNPAGYAGRAWANLERTGYTGRVHLVNPRHASIGGHAAVPSVRAIDDEVDAAVILVPAASVLDAVRECAESGIRAITVCTAGFGELGEEGRETERQMAEIARTAGSRVIGPNCIGVLNVVDGYVPVPTYNISYETTPGAVTLISQSGGMAVNLFNRAQGRGIGIRALVTLGNEADIEMAEMIEALVDDLATRVIALFMERVSDGERFLRAARVAYAAGKPVVALKVGRSEVGQRSVAGHTGRLAGEPEVYAGVMAQAGVLEVSTLDELLNTAHVLATLPAPAGRRVGVFTVSGGESSYVADEGTARGLEFPFPGSATVDALLEIVRFAVPGNPFDATGQIIGNPEFIRSALDVFCADPGFDMLALTTAAWGPHDAEALLPSVVAAAEAAPVPTVICSWSARNHTERGWEILRASSVPAFETSDDGVAALANLARYRLDTAHVGPSERVRERYTPAPVALAQADSSVVLDEHEAKRLLVAAGVPVVEEEFARDREEALAAFLRLGAPVAVKLIAAGVVHKTEAGLVRLGIADEAALDAALAELDRNARDLNVRGYLVQRMETGIEMILGGAVDPTFGPVVMVGAGGVLAEHERDVRFLAVPATRAEIVAALDALRMRPVLAGLRGAAPDVEALIDAVEAFARFVDGARDWLESCDVNPLLVGERGAGVVAVDATVEITGAP